MSMLDEVKAGYSVRAELASDYPEAIRGILDRARTTVVCPFCEDTNGSASVDDTGYHCHQCGLHFYSIIGYEMETQGLNEKQAVRSLYNKLKGANAEARKFVKQTKPDRNQFPPTTLSMEKDVEPYFGNISEALKYFQSRAITEPVAYSHKLGLGKEVVTRPYVDMDGKTHWFKSPRYTIPTVRGDEVISVNMRRDDEWCYNWIEQAENWEQVFAVKNDYANKKGILYQDVTDKRVVESCFGPKYWRKGVYDVFNYGRVARKSDQGIWIPLRLPYILITEGEIDAMSLESFGYASIGAKWKDTLDLASVLSLTSRIIIVADNDPLKKQHDGSFRKAGDDHATRMYQYINKLFPRKAVITIHPPAEFNDANEVLVAGEGKTWLSRFGISPILNTQATTGKSTVSSW